MTGLKTIRITGVNQFDTAQFLRRIHSTGLEVSLLIHISSQTGIYLSVAERGILRKRENLRMDVLKNLLENCTYEDSEISHVHWRKKLVLHVVGEPKPQPDAMENIVSKLLSDGVESCVLLRILPVQDLFGFSLAIAVPFTDKEREHKTIVTLSALLRSGLGENIHIMKRKTSHSIHDLLMKNGPFMLLNTETASALFQLPVTYGVTKITEMGFPVPSSPLKGIKIGTPAEFSIPDLRDIRLDADRLFEHMAVWGASGTGKTTFLKNLLINLEKTGVRFCVIDWHNEYRSIVGALQGKLGEDVVILNPLLGSLSLNPLELPEAEMPREMLVWERIENFISLVEQMFILGEIQEARLREVLSDLYSRSSSPTIGEVVALMSERKLRTLSVKLRKFSEGFYGRIFNRRHSSLSFSDLRRKNVIIELGQLPGEVRMFFACVFLILWWDNLRLDETSPNVLVLDDFYRYGRLSAVRKMLSEARKFRQGLICSHQGPYQLPEGIREEVIRNTATKVIFRQEQTWDKYIVRDALGGLTKEQIESLSYLDTGQAVVRLPSVKFPIRVDTPSFPEIRSPGDGEVREAMKGFIGEPETTEEVPAGESPEKSFLEEIHRRPQAPLTEVTKALGMKTSRGYELKNRLVREGYLEEERIRKGRGRPRVVFRLTRKGLEYLGQEGQGRAPQYGKSEHLFMVNRVASMLKGWNVSVEEGCDVMAEKDGYMVAIEVETGKSGDRGQLLYNLRRDSDWADKIVIVCPNKKMKLRVEEMMRDKTKTETVVITYRQIGRLNDILKPKLTMRMLRSFWSENSVGGMLSTTGLRKLLLACFGIGGSEKLEKPKYPFWDQSANVQAQVIAMLETHPHGKKVVEEIEKQLSNLLS